MSGVFLLILTAILSILYFFRQPRAIPVRPKEAQKLIHSSATVIDVRTDEEWAIGHYPTAFHIPLADLQKELPKHIIDRSIILLIYCRTGRRSFFAADIANRLGYTTVYYLVDGSYEELEETFKIH